MSTLPRHANASSTGSASRVYLRLFKYAWHYKFVFGLSILALIVFSLTNTGFIATIKQVTDEGFVQKDPSKLNWLPLMLAGLLVVRACFNFISIFSMRWVARRVVEDLRLSAFRKLMEMPISFFDTNSAGVLTSKLTYDTEQVAKASTNVAVSVVRDTLTIIGMLGYMLYLDWRLTLIFAVTTPLMALYIRNSTPKIRSSGRAVQDTMGMITKSAEEAISGQRMIKIFGGEEYEFNRFAKAVSKNRHMHINFIRRSNINSLVIELLAAAALGMVVYYATGKFSAGEFAAFIGALLMLISPIKSLSGINEDLQMGIAAAQGLFGLIDSHGEMNEGQESPLRSNGKIQFLGVGFRYENSKNNALNEINFELRPGEKVALVGRSGGGKTTIVNLLARFYETSRGKILLDGQDIRTMSIKSLRKQFAMVSQEVVLFNDTVFNNIAYGVLRTSSEDAVIAAAKAAHAWEFIQQLPNGLYSEIGDRGVRLSGGQRQRLAIARAILKDAPILLLDEATSALDTESEKHVQAALDELMRNRTSIVIAHRLSTIENADRILVVEHGEIIESGTHAELIANDGHYAALYRRQFH